MASQMNDEPRYGQRSSEHSQGTPSQAPSQASTPWPQYGQIPAEQGPSYGTHQPHGTYQGAEHNASQATQSGADLPLRFLADDAVRAMGSSYGQQFPSTAPAPHQNGYFPNTGAPVLKVPSRVGPILLIVFGILSAVIIAPLAFVGGILGGIDFTSMMDRMSPVASGDTVTVDDSGALMVVSQAGNVTSCSLEGSGGTHRMELVGNDTFFAQKLERGDYVLECVGSGSSNLLAFSGLDADSIMNAGFSGFTWGTGVGVLSLFLTVGGIVWLIVVNQKRKVILTALARY